MKNFTFETLNYIFSKTRLSPYLKDGDNVKDVLEKYHSNIILSEAMIPSLHYLEICLRNRIDQLFKKTYASDWLITIPHELILSTEDLQKIGKISRRIRRESRREPIHDDIVAQMTFGFWCSFFHKKYDPVIWHRKNFITSVFPNLPRNQRKRSYIEQKILKIKEVRNRIAHHEPIWNRSSSVHLSYSVCIGLIQAISQEALDLMKLIDRFPAIEKKIASNTI